MIVEIERRWKLHTGFTVFMLFAFQFVCMAFLFGQRSLVMTFAFAFVYAVAATSSGICKWYCIPRKVMLFRHAFIAAAFTLAAFLLGKNYKALILLVFLNLVFFLWTYFAKYWIHRQIEPLWTLVIGDEELLDEWIAGHRDIYDKAYYMKDFDFGEIGRIIEMYRIPLILTDKTPGEELIKMAKEKKVVIHFVSKKAITMPKDLVKNERYKGLYVLHPFAV